MTSKRILIRGARQHNLKNITLEIPRDALTVITGLSGSGKSSLAFDTIYAEGQRRYIESLSAYARQFLDRMDKPDVDYIEGLSPAIAIEQKAASKNPRSTVATVTEIHDYFRLLFARIGRPHCPNCGKEISKQTVQQMVDKILGMRVNMKFLILAPVVRSQKGEHKQIFEEIKRKGMIRAKVDNRIINLEENISLDKNKRHTIEIVVDRLVLRPNIAKRLADSLQTCLKLSKGIVAVEIQEGAVGDRFIMSESMACTECGISIEELSPRMFSFNSPFGACKDCSGLGTKMTVDLDLVIPDKTKSIREGAIVAWGFEDSWSVSYFESMAKHYDFSLDTPISSMDSTALDTILYGSGNEQILFKYSGRNKRWSYEQLRATRGIISSIERRYKETESEKSREWYEQFFRIQECPSCRGTRYRPESLAVKVGGRSIAELSSLTVDNGMKWFQDLELAEKEEMIAKQILKEVRQRLAFMSNVGLEYLNLDRPTSTLSGGEAQRIHLASQIGSSLVGVLYVLDEPSIGLHQRDNGRLISTLKRLRDSGNTVLVVEHDEGIILSSDHVVDLGPGAGNYGGRVVASGSPGEIKRSPNSITGKYLSHRLEIPIPKTRRRGRGNFITIRGARANNLKNIEVKIPLEVFTCITGVSGSGKSSLIDDILHQELKRQLYNAKVRPGDHDEITGIGQIDKAIIIDQSPIGRTPRSNPATYTGVFTEIRNLFAQLPEAGARGYRPGRFSFNVKGGRCEACDGDGIIRLEMHFLPDVYVQCDVCKGRRYNRETLELKFKGKSIADVLEMDLAEALVFFENFPKIKSKLIRLNEVGLGYMAVGQPATTLSGGEAQRVKLSTELGKRATGRTLYLLDEPTTGLHFDDVRRLLEVLNTLVDAGNSLVIVEHNLDVIKTADHIIDLGPEGGDEGGNIVAEGTPENVALNPNSYTGKFLARTLHTFGTIPAKPRSRTGFRKRIGIE